MRAPVLALPSLLVVAALAGCGDLEPQVYDVVGHVVAPDGAALAGIEVRCTIVLDPDDEVDWETTVSSSTDRGGAYRCADTLPVSVVPDLQPGPNPVDMMLRFTDVDGTARHGRFAPLVVRAPRIKDETSFELDVTLTPE